MTNTPIKTLGTFEPVSFPDFAVIGKITAKIDTGAYSGALHCTMIRLEETPKGKVLHFSPFDHPDTEISVSNFTLENVRSSNGKNQSRYFVNTNIKIQGAIYPIILSLADRSEMKWPVLIGRKFLRKNNFLVDVNRPAK